MESDKWREQQVREKQAADEYGARLERHTSAEDAAVAVNGFMHAVAKLAREHAITGFVVAAMPSGRSGRIQTCSYGDQFDRAELSNALYEENARSLLRRAEDVTAPMDRSKFGR